jgi:hypothetical protein
MSKRSGLAMAAGAVAAILAAAPARAVDPWEAPPYPDDNGATINTLGHGSVQVHDLDQGGTATNDIDWVAVATLDRHSYEVRLNNASVQFDWGICTDCAQFERVSIAGSILTEDVPSVAVGVNESYDRSVRWVATASTLQEYVRVTGHQDVAETANSVYTLRFWDTTYSIARWNNSASQVTVVVLSSQAQANASGNIYFYSSAGTLLHTQGFTLAQNQTFVFNTSSVPALVGQSGYAQVAHTAGYGGLSGKAVSLEPTTGFTFDTGLTAMPQ